MPAVVFVAARSAREADHSLRCSLAAMTEAKQCAVLWFGEIMQRQLYRALGFSSINQYAMNGLGFSKSRAGDFIRLARELKALPAVQEALASGELGYTKALEIIKVATPENEGKWLGVAEGSRKELVREVKKARRLAAVDPGQGELLPAEPAVVAPREIPVHLHVKFSPEQEARRSALVERLHKLGGVPSDRAELMLEALAALAEAKESKTRRRVLDSRPPVQIHVHEDKASGRMTIQTHSGERELSRAESERMSCDAAICEEGGRNTTTIPPRTRRRVLARDHHQCQAPGCGRTRFLEVHHIKPRRLGGTNKPENLTTLCAACHRLWHERGGHRVQLDSDQLGLSRTPQTR